MSDLRTAAQQIVEEWRTDYGSVRMASLMMKLEATLAESVPPPEAQTEAEKIAYCAGWWDALEKKRSTASSTCEPLPPASPSQT